MLDHLSIQCADVPTAAAFYDAVLAPLGGGRQMDFGEVDRVRHRRQAVVLARPARRPGHQPAHPRGLRRAPTAPRCDAFFDAAVDAGAEVLHEPRLWPEYHPAYYGAFVRDPDGNNVEAVCHAPE